MPKMLTLHPLLHESHLLQLVACPTTHPTCVHSCGSVKCRFCKVMRLECSRMPPGHQDVSFREHLCLLASTFASSFVTCSIVYDTVRLAQEARHTRKGILEMRFYTGIIYKDIVNNRKHDFSAHKCNI